MNINFSDLSKTMDKTKEHKNVISMFMEELEKSLEKGIELMDSNIKEYTIDRFEGNIAVCEDRATKEMTNIKIENLPKGIKEGSILTYKNGEFFINKEKENEIEKRIKEKMNNLWNN